MKMNTELNMHTAMGSTLYFVSIVHVLSKWMHESDRAVHVPLPDFADGFASHMPGTRLDRVGYGLYYLTSATSSIAWSPQRGWGRAQARLYAYLG